MLRTLRAKIIFVVGMCCVSVSLALVIASTISLKKLGGVSETLATRQLQTSIHRQISDQSTAQAVQAQMFFHEKLQLAEQISSEIQQLFGLYGAKVIASKTVRDQIIADIKAKLEKQPGLLSIYAVFQPEVLGDMEADAAGGNANGRFTPVWYRPQGGDVTLTVFEEATITDDNLMADGKPTRTWFDCPVQTSKPCLLSPYVYDLSGTPILMTSLTVPVKAGGKVIGVVGIDITLDRVSELTVLLKSGLPESKGDVQILSDTGFLAGASDSTLKLGSHFAAREITAPSMIDVKQDFRPIPGAAAWKILVKVPEQVAYAPLELLKQQLQDGLISASQSSIVIAIVVVMVGLTLVAVTLTIILKPLQALAKMTQELAGAGGDLNRRLNHQKNDELGEVCLGLNGFLDVLQPMVDTLKGSMHNLSGSATQAQIGSAESHNLMRQQRTEIDLVSSAMQQMTLAAHEVARSTESAARAASDIVVVVDNGTELIKQTSALVNRQIQDLGDANDQMRLLSERSERIGGVLDIIRGIAERTNLLALNAAIEAARAGEHGRGFAVVADEVRNLAKRTQDSIQEIHTIIDTLQRDTGIVVQSVTSTQVQSQELGELFINLVAALDQVGAGVAKIGEMNTQIASATEEQSAVSSDINRSVTSIGILTESLADQLEQSAGEIRSVGHCADEQRIMLERFRT